MSKQRFIETIGWGTALWFLGFAFSMMLFPFIPVKFLGLPVLAIMAFFIFAAGMKVFKEKKATLMYALTVAFSWLLLVIVLDYFVLVKTFNIENYYDIDLIVYYTVTFILPLIAWKKYANLK